MKVYEVLTSYSSTEVHHVKANSEEEALKKFRDGHYRYVKTYDGECLQYQDVAEVGDNDGPWELADYEKEYGKFET